MIAICIAFYPQIYNFTIQLFVVAFIILDILNVI